MKNIYTMAAGFLLCAGLASCEMKEELFGKGEVPSETGKVELGVAVNDKTNVVITKADATAGNDSQGSNVDPAEYPVIFTHQSADYTKECVYEDIDGTEVILPIGEYLVESHTPGELKKQMTYPYYGGEANLKIAKDVTEEAKVVCTMQNSRILLTYENFSSKFSTWTITIDDSSDKTLTFTQENGVNPDPVYWYFGENCSSIRVNVTATTTAGATVFESRTITKPDGASDPNWTGGDALTITMTPSEDNPDPGNPSGVQGSGINITVKAFFETEKDETVEVPIEGEETPTDPGDGGDDDDDGGDDTPTTEDPSITSDYLTSGISLTICQNPDWKEGDGLSTKYNVVDSPSSAEVVISATKGFESIKVKIDASANSEFESAISLFGLQNEVNILASNLDETLKTLLSPPTDPNATTYSLNVANFFSMMAWYGPTVPDTYDFIIKVKDKEGNEAGPTTLSVSISEE